MFDKKDLILLDLALGLAIKKNEEIKNIDKIVYESTKTRMQDLQKRIWAQIYPKQTQS